MPGRVYLTTPFADIEGAALGRNITPGETVGAIGPDGPGAYRWGIIPVGRKNARGRPVMETIVNARSETVFDKSAFDGVGRAVLPVQGWYEWTGETRKKTAWDISAKDGSLLYFAAITDIWTAPGGLTVPQLATVTCPPNTDLKDIHHRMAVILRETDIDAWLYASEPEAARLMHAWPDGLLSIKRAESSHLR